MKPTCTSFKRFTWDNTVTNTQQVDSMYLVKNCKNIKSGFEGSQVWYYGYNWEWMVGRPARLSVNCIPKFGCLRTHQDKKATFSLEGCAKWWQNLLDWGWSQDVCKMCLLPWGAQTCAGLSVRKWALRMCSLLLQSVRMSSLFSYHGVSYKEFDRRKGRWTRKPFFCSQNWV